MQTPTSSLAVWIQTHGHDLLAFLSRRLNCRNTAADLAQETYLRLHLYAGEAAIDNLGAFAYRVAANLATDHQRKQATRHRFETNEVEWETLADEVDAHTPPPEEILRHRQRLTLLQQALAELPEDCRMAFYLSRIQGLSHDEIAARLTRCICQHGGQALNPRFAALPFTHG